MQNTCPNVCVCAPVNRFVGQMNDCRCHMRTDVLPCACADEFAAKIHEKIPGHSVCTDVAFRRCAFWQMKREFENVYEFIRMRGTVPSNSTEILPHMNFKIRTFDESSITFGTSIWFHSAVPSCVQIQSASRFECFRALFALEWPFIGVSLVR